VKVFSSLTQNLTHTRCSWKSVIFYKKKSLNAPNTHSLKEA
jgi:hypothetical protein